LFVSIALTTFLLLHLIQHLYIGLSDKSLRSISSSTLTITVSGFHFPILNTGGFEGAGVLAFLELTTVMLYTAPSANFLILRLG
jgi:hypothetical protein